MLESLSAHYKFSVDQPFESLLETVRHAVLFGSGVEEIKFSYTIDSGASSGKRVNKKHANRRRSMPFLFKYIML